MSDIASKIEAFRRSVSPNLLSQGDFIDWGAVNADIRNVRRQIDVLQAFVDIGDLSTEAVTGLLSEDPQVYQTMLGLIAFNNTGEQVEKWGLPNKVSPNTPRTKWVAEQLLHIGIGQLLEANSRIADQVKIAAIYRDSFRRRFRSGKSLKTRVELLVKRAISKANEQTDVKLALNYSMVSDPPFRRSVDYVVASAGRPIAGIATVFQSQSGGRQQRDLSLTYPTLQSRFSEEGIALILIADGQGLLEASDRTLAAMFEGVKFPMTLDAASNDALVSALLESSNVDRPETPSQAGVNRLIAETLRSSLKVSINQLPLPGDKARLALATYAQAHREQALAIEPSGEVLSWVRSDFVKTARDLKVVFDPCEAILLLAALLPANVSATDAEKPVVFGKMTPPNIQPFSDGLVAAAAADPLQDEVNRELGRRSMEEAPGSPIAVYLTKLPLADGELQSHRNTQVFRPANIVVLSPEMLEKMAGSRAPIDSFIDAVLEQSDLTKISPFILNNATPPRMFYGREAEAATVLGTIATNSVAVLGSRRIGKTSLIRRVQKELTEARFQPFFGDCQTVKTWQDFAEMAQSKWEVTLPSDFRPSHLEQLVKFLAQKGDGPVVIILDEIDALLEWDLTHDDRSVNEAFFRSCRSISQSGAAQFVFSGERRIANRLWDPQSPHWNFCRPLLLTQLQQRDAQQLLIDPIQSMNIRIKDVDSFANIAWQRTSGHPQIVQFLGDRLVRNLDKRENRRDLELGVDEIEMLTNTLEYADHYVETYWGQASSIEKRISQLVVDGADTIAALVPSLPSLGIDASTEQVNAAVRMLQLYGILEETDGALSLRAEWLPHALSIFGPKFSAPAEFS